MFVAYCKCAEDGPWFRTTAEELVAIISLHLGGPSRVRWSICEAFIFELRPEEAIPFHIPERSQGGLVPAQI